MVSFGEFLVTNRSSQDVERVGQAKRRAPQDIDCNSAKKPDQNLAILKGFLE
jgi:hypothetical protein